MTEYILKFVDLLHETTEIFPTSLRSLLWWQIATLGLTFGITQSKLFNGLRRLVPLLKCTQCVGFWAGIFLLLFNSPILNAGLTASFICFTTYLLLAELIKKHG